MSSNDASEAMVRLAQRCGLFLLCLVTSGAATTVAAQGGDSAKANVGALVGRVVDTSGTAIQDAEVVITRPRDNTVIARATSNKKGNVTFPRLPTGEPYRVVARKIGYGAAQGELRLRAGDTLYVDFELPPLATVLAPITVTARRNRFSIEAGEFNPKLYRDPTWLLADKRPDMLGDPERCPPPDPIFGGPSQDNVARIKITDRIMLGGNSRGARAAKRQWRSFDNLNNFHGPKFPYVQQLYVNGVRVDWRPVNGSVVPGRSVGEQLQRIPLDQIASIRYVDCWDTSVPPHMQYALYVTLKPASRAVQDSVLRSIMKKPDTKP